MLINSINIKSFNAKLLTVDIQTQELSNSSEWLDNSLSPLFLANKKQFKKIDLEIAFKGASRTEILNNISNFMSKLINEVILTLDKYDHKYKVILKENSTEKTISKNLYKKKLSFIGYEFSDEVIENLDRITTKTINVAGNLLTPATVEITPSIDIIDLQIDGLSNDSIIIKNLHANKKIIINSEDATVLEEGANKFIDTDMWEFPFLSPGANKIKISKNNCNIKIKYRPRYI